jgi:acyl-CoA synthetase (AMP-forming)/AMP-acid ligase II
VRADGQDVLEPGRERARRLARTGPRKGAQLPTQPRFGMGQSHCRILGEHGRRRVSRCARDTADDQQLDTLTLAWASHRLGGIQSPANAVYSAEELEYQLKNSGAKALFTCVPLLETARKAAKGCGISENRIYLLDLPDQLTGGKGGPSGMKTVDDLIREGKALDRLEPLNWASGDGAKKAAFLCYSSGTSGLPKGVMISHRNVIANTSTASALAEAHQLTVCSANRYV